MKKFLLIVVVTIAGMLSSCGGDEMINYSCDEPQLYQAVQPAKRIVAPEGLDPLNELAEMPIPKAENVVMRPAGSRCIELPPKAGSVQ